MRRTHTATVVGAAALVFALTLSACSSPAPSAQAVAQSAPAVTTTPATPTPLPTPEVEVPRVLATLAPAAPVVAPVRVKIAAIGINVPIVPVGVEKDGFMEIPPNPAIAGWYRYGSTPSAALGDTVIAAHIDSPNYAIGPFASLRSVPAGADVTVSSADGTSTRYAVESVTYYLKADLPTDQLFTRDGPPSLVLITCGGEFNSATGHYKDNVVLVARKVA